MKKFISFIIGMLIILSTFTVAFAAEKKVTLIAHRGYSSVAPENTLAAVREAGKAKFQACEFDIQPTKDHAWVVMHNDTVDTMTDGEGKISDLTLAEIKSFRIDAGNGLDKYPDERIPTLEEMLDECKKSNIHPVVEIKGGDEQEVSELCEYLLSRKDRNKFTVISFEEDYLKQVKRLIPNMKCYILLSDIPDWAVEFCLENNIDGIDFKYKESNKEAVKAAKKANLELVAWTVDKSEAFEDLYNNMGVYSVTTNKLSKEKVLNIIPQADFNVDEEIIKNCSCNCHKSGFMGFIWKIQCMFYKLFGTNKFCACSVKHY